MEQQCHLVLLRDSEMKQSVWKFALRKNKKHEMQGHSRSLRDLMQLHRCQSAFYGQRSCQKETMHERHDPVVFVEFLLVFVTFKFRL